MFQAYPLTKQFYLFVILLLCCHQTIGQTNEYILEEYLTEHTAQLNVLPKDIEHIHVLSDQFSVPSGLTHLYFTQYIHGYPLINCISNAAIKNGQVQFFANQLGSNIHQRINTQEPALTASEALFHAAEELDLASGPIQVISEESPTQVKLSPSAISQLDIPCRLVYYQIDEQTIRLTWDLSILTLENDHWWSLRVDAITGQILDKTDWMQSCSFDHSTDSEWSADHQCASSGFSFPKQSAHQFATSFATDQYNVYALPTESPNHGNRSLVIGPADALASPHGWHDTDGSSGPEFTNTQGNNVIAQDDANGNNGNGSLTDGGVSLDFNIPLNLNQAPAGYQDASIVNLFYMNNMMHDVWYHYGFDEASGNFQENNYGRGGAGSDRVNADAQDGSGLNNANFGTPPDGGNPRMQMFLWSAPAANVDLLAVNNSSLAGIKFAEPAAFGAAMPNTALTRDLVVYDDGTPDNEDACTNSINATALNGKIVLIRRGSCTFVSKVANAEAAGADAVIVVNNVAGSPITMGGTDPGIGIPAVMVSQDEGEPLITAVLGGQTISATLHDKPTYQLDGDFDNGIIAHEYGHGISNRLTGGRTTSNCLSNDEQMGEGWSDWFGLILTIEPGDLPTDIRGIGTYAIGQPTSGDGIRPQPYSTDPTINNVTYASTNNTGAISMPHGIGFVWCSMLWDLTWAFIDTYGYDPDIYTGTGGNNMVMELIMEAMKLQPCNPGFVDGRDAILNADQALNNGNNFCLIWNVFAARGVGLSASQGSTNSRTDQSEAFDLPASITTPLSVCISSLSTSLPLELTNFYIEDASLARLDLSWYVEMEQSIHSYIIERSSDGILFSPIGQVMSSDNFSANKSYTYTDHNPMPRQSYYRLKVQEDDASYTYSKTISQWLTPRDLVSVFPNPSRDRLVVTIHGDEDQEIRFQILDIMGREIPEFNFINPKGQKQFEMDIQRLSSGHYVLNGQSTNGQTIIRKTFTKI